VLYGPPPSDILPEVTDAELNAFVYQDLAEFWRPSLGSRPDLALQDIWVDLGLLTLARALVTLRDGKLITKGEALDVLIKMGAPTEVVEDIRQRRYGDPQQCTDIATDAWRRRRADLAFPFYLSEIDRVLTNYAV
jgi:hypothetical protein